MSDAFSVPAPGSRNGGVGDDQPIEIRGEDDAGDRIHAGLIEIGRDLQEHGHAGLRLGASGQHFAEEPRQRLVGLQVAQPRRIGRGNVHGEVVGQIGEALHPQHIVGDEILAVLVGADIDPQCGRHAQALQALESGVVALIVEPHAVDDAFGLSHPEEARLGIAGLRARGHGADLDHAEAHEGQRARHFGILVEAGGHADRVLELEATKGGGQFRRIRMLLLWRQAQPQRRDGGAVGGFRIHAQERVAGEIGEARIAQQG